MSVYPHHPLIIVRAADQDRANQAAHFLGGDPADLFTFEQPLNGTGLPIDPPTHYWCSPALTEADYQKVQALIPQFSGATVQDWDGDDPDVPEALLARLRLRRIATSLP